MDTVGTAHIINTSNELCTVLGFFLLTLKHLQKDYSMIHIGNKKSYYRCEQLRNRLVGRAGEGCILSPCLFNLYAEYIMRNAGLDERQLGDRIARRNINNLRYDTTFWQRGKRKQRAS